MVFIAAVVLRKDFSLASVDLRVNVRSMFSLPANLIEDLQTVVMLAKVKFLFGLRDSQQELGVSLAIQMISGSLQELDCLFNVAVLATHIDCDERKLDWV